MVAQNPREIPLEEIPCPLCHANQEAILYEAHDRLYGMPGTFRVVQCQRCTLVYLNPRPTQEGLSFYYPKNYFSHQETPAPARRNVKSWIRNFVLPIYFGYPGKSGFKKAKALNRLLALPLYGCFKADRHNTLVIPFQGAGRFLDVGCGSGKMLFFMQSHGWEVSGIEIDETLAHGLRTKFHLNVFSGSLSECSFAEGSFDVVHMSHVLEHLPTPMRSMEKVNHLLRKGGRVYLRFPNGHSFTAQWFKNEWFGLDVPRHLCTYTGRTVRMLLENTGFEVEYIKQDRNSSILKNTLLHGKRSYGSRVLAGITPLMRTMEGIFALLGRGSALIVSARKQGGCL